MQQNDRAKGTVFYRKMTDQKAKVRNLKELGSLGLLKEHNYGEKKKKSWEQHKK